MIAAYPPCPLHQSNTRLKENVCSTPSPPTSLWWYLLTGYTAKRAETRPCPVCEELIPIRLLGKHLDLELQRVEDIVKAVGSTEVLQDDDREEGYAPLLT